ncbi:MAG: acetate--CoA ligase family protein [Deltaproteobacteria bacterium]|nr:acetate--CoA ligase family protein [Deltaproteobacteria bacterium]
MDNREIERLVKEAVSLGKKTLVEPEAKEVLRLASIPVPRFQVVKDVTAAVEAAGRIGYPLVLKLVSPDITHKSDVGGVAVGIKDAKELELTWSQMILNVADENPVAMIEGFLIEEMAPKGVEVIVGAIKDEQFGPVAMFGVGGVAVELMKDVSFRLAPLDKKEAFEMMAEVKGFPLLTGFRGGSFKDLDAIADVIIKLAGVISSTDGLKEIEINPLIVYDEGAIAVDARAVIG